MAAMEGEICTDPLLKITNNEGIRNKTDFFVRLLYDMCFSCRQTEGYYCVHGVSCLTSPDDLFL